MDNTHSIAKDAYISTCGTYRYWLTREWDESNPLLVWLMLNPSTADASQDDATMRKCMSYARKWGYGGITVINVYALRSRDPKNLWKVSDPVGPHNNRWISLWMGYARRRGSKIICGWSKHPKPERIDEILEIAENERVDLEVVEMGQHGPKHPLYLKGDLKPVRFR